PRLFLVLVNLLQCLSLMQCGPISSKTRDYLQCLVSRSFRLTNWVLAKPGRKCLIGIMLPLAEILDLLLQVMSLRWPLILICRIPSCTFEAKNLKMRLLLHSFLTISSAHARRKLVGLLSCVKDLVSWTPGLSWESSSNLSL